MTAVFDTRENVLVIRVVYDGPPLAGKTTSLTALAQGLGRTVHTPEEVEGRTAYFDWMEYTGGRFDGAEIRCEVLTVPGQKIWAHRRRALLEEADVVVFVGDTTREGWPGTMETLRELREQLDAREKPPVGVVFQANKRDRATAIPLAELREELGAAAARIGIVESVAQLGAGIRETFVFAVRLALDRVRELQKNGGMSQAETPFAGEELLLEKLKKLERAARCERPRIEESLLPVRAAPLRAPTPDVQSGLIWPPVEGRIILHEATQNLSVATTKYGDFVGGHGTNWRIFSRARASFTDLEEGRAALVAWARQHAVNQILMSGRRSVVLSEDSRQDSGGWRLWQIIKSEPSLRDLLNEKLRGRVEDLAHELAWAARFLLDAQRRMEKEHASLTCSLRTIGRDEHGQPIYVGLMPSLDETPLPPSDEKTIARELARFVATHAPRITGAVARSVGDLSRNPHDFANAGQLLRALANELETRAGAEEVSS